jgi:hypothetical protein
LPKEFVLLAHPMYDESQNEFLQKHPELEDSLINQLRMIRENPYCGSSMKYAPKELQSKVYKRKIGGRRGYNLLYVVFRNKSVVLCVYIMPIPRKEVDYRKGIPWNKLLAALDDYQEGNLG